VYFNYGEAAKREGGKKGERETNFTSNMTLKVKTMQTINVGFS
jgi:hypothetical protein